MLRCLRRRWRIEDKGGGAGDGETNRERGTPTPSVRRLALSRPCRVPRRTRCGGPPPHRQGCAEPGVLLFGPSFPLGDGAVRPGGCAPMETLRIATRGSSTLLPSASLTRRNAQHIMLGRNGGRHEEAPEKIRETLRTE